MSWTHTVRRALKKLRYPDVDAHGNLVTNGIVPRTDTLENLMSVADASAGEIAAATDVEALVLYRNDGGTIYPRPIFRGGYLFSYASDFDGTYPTGENPLSLRTGSVSPPGLVVSNEFVLPAYTPQDTARDVLYFNCTLSGVFYGFTAASNINIAIQGYVNTAWVDIDQGLEITMTTDGSGTYTLNNAIMMGRLASISLSSCTKLRVSITVAGAATGTATSSGLMFNAWSMDV